MSLLDAMMSELGKPASLATSGISKAQLIHDFINGMHTS